jgi:hypothetical protein
VSGRLVSVTWPGSPGGQCWYRRLAPGHHRPPAPGHRRGHRQDMRPDRSIRTPELGLTRTPGHAVRNSTTGEPHPFPMTGRLASHAPGVGRNGTFIEHIFTVVKDYFAVSVFFSSSLSLAAMAGRDPAILFAADAPGWWASQEDHRVRPGDDAGGGDAMGVTMTARRVGRGEGLAHAGGDEWRGDGGWRCRMMSWLNGSPGQAR